MESTSVIELRKRLRSLSTAVGPTDLNNCKLVVGAAFGHQSTDFLSDLYDVAVTAVQGELPAEPSLSMVCAAAALQLLPGHKASIVQQFLQSFFVPLLSSVDILNSAAYAQISADLCNLLVNEGLWQMLQQLAQDAMDTISETAQPAGTKASGDKAKTRSSLPLHAATCIAVAALKTCSRTTEANKEGSGASRALLEAAVQQLGPAALRIVGGNTVGQEEGRQAAVRSLLPAIMACALCLGPQQVGEMTSALLGQCCEMLAVPGQPRRTALALLVQFAPLLQDISGPTEDREAMWARLRSCLAGEDALDRKRAVHVLQQLLPPSLLRTPAWSSWLTLHSLLEEFGLHLIQPAWSQMDQLHAVDPQFSKTQAPTTSAHTRRNKLRQRGNRRKGGAGKAPAAGGAEAGREEGVQDQEGEGEDDGGAAASGPTAATWAGMDAASLTWQCVLWQRALQHANLQVQKLGLQSFLQRAWAPRPGSEPDTAPPGARCHSEVPVIFVAEVLIPALAKDIHYRGATGNMDLQVRANQWLCARLASADTVGQREILAAAVNVLSSKDVPRLGLQHALAAISQAAAHATALNHASDHGAWAHSMLLPLHTLAMSIFGHQGSNFKTAAYGQMLQMAAAAAPVSVVGPEAAMGLVMQVPEAATGLCGQLHGAVCNYLFGAKVAEQSKGAVQVRAPHQVAHAVRMLEGLSSELLDAGHSSGDGRSVSNTDLKAIHTAAEPVARLLLVCGDSKEVVGPTQGKGLLHRLAQDLDSAYLRPHTSTLHVVRRLVLITRLCELLLPVAAALPADSPLIVAAVGLAQRACDSVVAYADLGVASMHPGEAALAAAAAAGMEDVSAQASAAQAAGAKGSVHHSPLELAGTLAGEVARGEVALQCAGALLQLLCAAPTVATAGSSHAACVGALAGPLIGLVSAVVSKAPPASSPSPTSGTHQSGGKASAAQAVAAAREGVRLHRLRALRAACSALASACSHSSHPAGLVLSQLSMQAAVAAVLSECAASVAAAGELAPTTRGAAAAACESEQWACVDAVISAAYAAHAAAPTAPSRAMPFIRFGGEEPAAAALSSSTQPAQHLPKPALTPHTLGLVLAGALDVVRYCGDDEIVVALRCVRRAWSQALEAAEDEGLQASLAAAISAPTTAGTALCAVCWAVQRAVCSSLAGGGGNNSSIAKLKKRGALCAALVNTILPPQLFALGAAGQDSSKGRALSPLHGQGGPVAWAMERVVEWGASAPRVVLMLCCQLSALVTATPSLMRTYMPQLQQLLLYGGRTDSAVPLYEVSGGPLGGESLGEGGAGAGGVEGEEVSLISHPSDPALVGAFAAAGSEVAPRAALLCGIYTVAQQAGCVWEPEGGDDAPVIDTPHQSLAPVHDSRTHQVPGATPATNDHTQKVATSGGDVDVPCDTSVGTKPVASGTNSSPPRTRPLIIVHGEGGWDDGSPLPHQPSPPARASSGAAGATSHSDTHCSAEGTCNAGSATTQGSTFHAGLAGLGRLSGPQTHTDNLGTSVNKAATPSASQLAPRVQQRPVSPAAAAAREAGYALWQQLLEFALTDKALTTETVKHGSLVHRQKVRVWQALAVLSSFVVGREAVRDAAVRVLGAFTMNEAPSVKQYQEAVGAALLLKQPELVPDVLLPLLTSYTKHHAGVGSLILLAGQVVMHAGPVWRPRLLPPLLMAIHPWLTCHAHSARTFAQLITCALLTQYPPGSPAWGHGPGDLTYLRHLMTFFDANADLARLRRTIGAPIITWRPAALTSPARLLGHPGIALAGTTPDNVTFEGAPATLTDRITSFLAAERYRLREEISDRLADIEMGVDMDDAEADARDDAHAKERGTGAADFQRKVLSSHQAALVRGGASSLATMPSPTQMGAQGCQYDDGTGMAGGAGDGLWSSMVHSGMAALLDAAEEEAGVLAAAAATPSGSPAGVMGDGDDLRGVVRSGGRRQEIIICATLVDKLPNLAGLARTCEVFRAAALVLPDAAMAADPAFSSISVTAERWVPCVEVREAGLLAWLSRQRAAGYTLLGLEQTAESTTLPAYPFPARCVLVLGREKEGMPPEVMQLLDATVEIPQLGLIRSLNVHVSGAIALYEYTRQHHLGLPPASAQQLAKK